MDESQVRDLFQVADLLAFTSIEENFANIILEASMCGCPVAGFELEGILDIVVDGVNGWLVPTITEKAYSNLLCDVLLNNKLADIAGSIKRWREANAHQFSNRNIAEKLLKFYGSLGYRHNAGQFDPVMRVLQYLSLMNRGFRRSFVLKGVPA